MKRTLAVLVQNQPGVLNRVAGLFSRRVYNIHSLNVGVTDDPEVSRMTIIVDGDEQIIEQVTKQLHKLIDVIKVSDITDDPSVDREMVLFKVKAEAAVRGEIMQIAEIFRSRIVDFSKKSMIIETTGDQGKLNAIENALKPFGIIEMVRTGVISMVRGSK
ncbi:MAG: acetolactate synthase small subunit [Firmicutes bacterium]|nr:acetolactate synthase small subunit [Bacillota bacterium]